LEIQSIVDKMNNMQHATRVIAKKNCLKSISLAGGNKGLRYGVLGSRPEHLIA